MKWPIIVNLAVILLWLVGIGYIYYHVVVPHDIDEVPSPLCGSLRIGGSTTVYPLAVRAAELYMERNPCVNITITESSTGEGIMGMLSGELDIVDATRPPTIEELTDADQKGMNLHMTTIGLDAVAVVVPATNTLENISLEELYAIFFSGDIHSWEQLGGNNSAAEITVYGTDPRISGTAELFINKVVLGELTISRPFAPEMFVDGYTIVYPTPNVVSVVALDPQSIAYTPLKWVNQSVRVVSIDGIVPDSRTILDGSYRLSRSMLMITDGTPTGLEADFIRFVLSKEGQQLVEDEGFVSLMSGEP